MIPYLGCKQSFASELLARMPAAEHFYDLFGGGGSVTEAACKCKNGGLFPWQKWQQVHYNEINKGVYQLCKEIWSGKFDFDYAKKQEPTKERYKAERSLQTAWGAFVAYVWSFGNKDQSFIYGEKLSQARGNEHLQRIKRMAKSPLLKVAMTNKDYREVKIKPHSIVYCDIPYGDHRKYYGVRFDFKAFYDWAKAAKFPVYFSGYENLGSHDFKIKWEKMVPVKINTKISNGKTLYRTEKLFWNGREG